jgi:hypothetical protein
MVEVVREDEDGEGVQVTPTWAVGTTIKVLLRI